MSRGAAIAAAAGGFVALVRAFSLDALIRAAVLPVVIAAVVGAGVGALSALAQHRRELLDVGSSEWLRPTAFDVVVDRESAAARHHLAQWWDPAAPPVEGQRVA
jgi:hypothetical protein